MKRFNTAIVLTAAILWLGANPGTAQEKKRQDLKATAAQIAAEAILLAKEQPVRLGTFVPKGPAFDGGDGVPSLEAELKAALGAHLNQKSTLELNGALRYTTIEKVQGNVINVEAQLENLDTKKVIKKIEVPILYVRGIAEFVGFSGVIDGGGSAGDGRDAIEDALKKPTAKVVKNTFATPAAGSPFQVEIRAKKEGAPGRATPRAVELVDGEPFVKIEVGEVYEVRVLNSADYEAAFNLSIDGIDQFAFTEDRSKGKPDYEHYLVSPAKNRVPGETVVYGWHKKFDPAAKKHQYFEFLTTKFGAGNIVNKPKSKVGMVTLSFSRSFEKQADAKTRGQDVETSKGNLGETGGDVVTRFINAPEEFLTIRYNREIK